MNWLKGHRKTLGIVVVFVVLITIIGLSYLAEGRSTPIGRMAKNVIVTVEKPINALGRGVQNGLESFFSFRKIYKENEALKEENRRLKMDLAVARLTENQLKELESLSEALRYQGIKEGYTPIAANVVSLDDSNLYHLFTIDVGLNQGVYEDALVLHGSGLVGTVYEVGDSWARIMPLLNNNQKISFSVFRDLSLVGIMQGEGGKHISGFMLDSEAGVIEGDTLVTSSVGRYPPGIEIGKVVKVEFNNHTQLRTVSIEPSVNFDKLQKVLVIL